MPLLGRLLCILTSFVVLRAPKSWSNYFFQPFSNFFYTFFTEYYSPNQPYLTLHYCKQLRSHLRSHQVSSLTLSPQFHYPSSMFPYCIQDDITSQGFSLSVGLKNPDHCSSQHFELKLCLKCAINGSRICLQFFFQGQYLKKRLWIWQKYWIKCWIIHQPLHLCNYGSFTVFVILWFFPSIALAQPWKIQPNFGE